MDDAATRGSRAALAAVGSRQDGPLRGATAPLICHFLTCSCMAGIKNARKKTTCGKDRMFSEIRGKKKCDADYTFPPLVHRRILFPPPPLHIPDLSLPLLFFFPSSSSKFWDFLALLGFGQKHKKGVFGSGSALHKGHLFVLGLGAGNLARPESRRLLQGNVSVLLSPSPAARPAVAFHGGDAGRASQGPA